MEFYQKIFSDKLLKIQKSKIALKIYIYFPINSGLSVEMASQPLGWLTNHLSYLRSINAHSTILTEEQYPQTGVLVQEACV